MTFLEIFLAAAAGNMVGTVIMAAILFILLRPYWGTAP